MLLTIGDVFFFKMSDFLIGNQGARVSLIYFLFNRRINELYNKTLTNGAEGILGIIGMHYFCKLTSKLDKNMALMTAAITLAFLVRSSSLVGWVPIALYQITRS